MARIPSNPYELTVVPYDAYHNRVNHSPLYDRFYDFTYQGHPGVKLADALNAHRGSDFMDRGDASMIWDGAKLDYRLRITGRTARHLQQHATCTVGNEKQSIPQWKAAKQAAHFVRGDLKKEPLFASDGRQLQFDDLYLYQLQQQNASLLVILAYYNVPQTNVTTIADPPAVEAPLSPPSPPPPPPTAPACWQFAPSYVLEPAPLSPSPPSLVWSGYPSASIPRSMYGPMTVIADPGLYGVALSASVTSYIDPSPSTAFDTPSYSITESNLHVQQSLPAGYIPDDWWMYKGPDNQAGPSYSYDF